MLPGIIRLREQPYLQLKGSGTAVAVVDSELTIGIRFSERNGQQNPLHLGPQNYREMGKKCLMVSSGKRILIEHWLRKSS